MFLQQKNTSPVNLSFGYNNRTCAVRITKGEITKRLEYRVASASANPSLVLNFIISALNFGLEKYFDANANKTLIKVEIAKFGPIFGNAFDKQYELTVII